MRFLSVCSGIEAASVAWNPLGWHAAAFSEIEPFPCSVLAHHYPSVPNRGDMTKFQEWPNDAIDLLCGGTPCQAFSVAGLRKGLADPRGNLMLTYGAIAAEHRPRWLVWENVPGVLSSDGGRDFGTFLGMLGQLGYGFAYRILDAQHFGVPQRRRRVFVVGCLGDWRAAAAVLFERHSLSGHPAPRRETRQDAAGTLTGGARKRGGFSYDDIPAVGVDYTNGLLNVDLSGTLEAAQSHMNRGHGVLAFDTTQVTSATNRSQPAVGDPCHPLAAGAHAPAIAFDCKSSGQNGFGIGVELAGTQRAMGHAASHTNGGGHQAVAYSTKLHNTASNNAGKIFEERTACLDANSPPPALLTAMQVRRLTPRECERLQGFPDDYTAVPHRGKPAADGPRYKALGNSWAVPCARWIGERINAVEQITAPKELEAA